MNKTNYEDDIFSLPTNKIPPTDVELNIIENFFKQEKKTKITTEVKKIFLVSAIFFIISLPIVDYVLKKIIKFTNISSYILILIKTIIFSIIYFLIQKFYKTT